MRLGRLDLARLSDKVATADRKGFEQGDLKDLRVAQQRAENV